LGLYINNNDQPSVYKNKEDHIVTTNQQVAKYNFMDELLEEQKKSTAELIQSIQDLNKLYDRQVKKQSVQWNNVNTQMKDIQIRNDYLTEYGSQIVEQLTNLDHKYKNLETTLGKDQQLQRSILTEIKSLKDFDQEIANRFDKNEAANQQISDELTEQLELQKELSTKLSSHEEFQSEVVKRLDNQEVLTEKIARQLNHIRSIIFERTNYLAEKIDEGYKLTSTYVYKLMNGNDQPLTFTLMKNKKKEEEKK